MRRRRKPFFLLEVVIAIALVALFVTYFIHSSLKQLLREEKEIAELKVGWQDDLWKMEVLTECWKNIEEVPKKKKHHFESVTSSQIKAIHAWCPNETEEYYHLILEEEKEREKVKYHFLVKKSEALSRS